MYVGSYCSTSSLPLAWPGALKAILGTWAIQRPQRQPKAKSPRLWFGFRQDHIWPQFLPLTNLNNCGIHMELWKNRVNLHIPKIVIVCFSYSRFCGFWGSVQLGKYIKKICLLELRQKDLPLKLRQKKICFLKFRQKKICFLKFRQEDLLSKASSRRFAS